MERLPLQNYTQKLQISSNYTRTQCQDFTLGTPTYSTDQRYQPPGLENRPTAFQPADPLPPLHRRHLLENRIWPDDEELKLHPLLNAQPDVQHRDPVHQASMPDAQHDTQPNTQPTTQQDAKDLTVPLLPTLHLMLPRFSSLSTTTRPRPTGYPATYASTGYQPNEDQTLKQERDPERDPEQDPE